LLLLLVNSSFYSQQDSARKAAIEIAKVLAEGTEEQVPRKNISGGDSTEIKLIKPSKEKEEAVFSDSKLKYENKGVDGKGIFQRFLEWLAELIFGNSNSKNTRIARDIIIWTIIIIAFAVIIRLLFKTQLISLVRPKTKATAFNFTDITEDLNTIDFEKKISEALLQSDYRLAIRWRYLKILFMLDKKNLITFAPFKTNLDYYHELSKSNSKINELKENNFHTSFTKLSRIYEYAWYGQFILKETDYGNNASDFITFEKQISA